MVEMLEEDLKSLFEDRGYAILRSREQGGHIAQSRLHSERSVGSPEKWARPSFV